MGSLLFEFLYGADQDEQLDEHDHRIKKLEAKTLALPKPDLTEVPSERVGHVGRFAYVKPQVGFARLSFKNSHVGILMAEGPISSVTEMGPGMYMINFFVDIPKNAVVLVNMEDPVKVKKTVGKQSIRLDVNDNDVFTMVYTGFEVVIL